MIECEYTTRIGGNEFSVFYDNRQYGWSAWLQGTGMVGWGYNAEEALAAANTRSGLRLTMADLTYVDHRYDNFDPSI